MANSLRHTTIVTGAYAPELRRPPADLEAASMRAFFTTPIFYVNASPHIGHLYSMILADVALRWAQFTGRQSIMSTGTDEHGMKVAAAASKVGKPPQRFVDELSHQFKQLAQVADIKYTRFVRTTDLDHVNEARGMWSELMARGYIYEGKHSGWYCISDETFYPESELIKDESSDSLVSRESGHKVEWSEEINYFFRLSKMKPALQKWLAQNPNSILPASRYAQITRELMESPLQDLSISRPAIRSPWGISVPHDPDHTMYVWFEALVNYLTVSKSQGDGKWWPGTHIIGKDILRFHCIYWPAFLMAAGLEPPKQVVIHGHWTLEGVKMSKSLHNVVDPFEAVARYGCDTVRYVLMHDSTLGHDSPFSYQRLVERHNVNLVNKLGNLVSRVGGPKFDIRNSLSELPLQSSFHLETLLERCDEQAASFEFGRVAHMANEAVMDANTSFQEAAPWAAEDPRKTVALAAETCRLVALVLQPIIPGYASRTLDRLGVSPDRRSSEWAHYGADREFGYNVGGGHLFQRLPDENR